MRDGGVSVIKFTCNFLLQYNIRLSSLTFWVLWTRPLTSSELCMLCTCPRSNLECSPFWTYPPMFNKVKINIWTHPDAHEIGQKHDVSDVQTDAVTAHRLHHLVDYCHSSGATDYKIMIGSARQQITRLFQRGNRLQDHIWFSQATDYKIVCFSGATDYKIIFGSARQQITRLFVSARQQITRSWLVQPGNRLQDCFSGATDYKIMFGSATTSVVELSKGEVGGLSKVFYQLDLYFSKIAGLEGWGGGVQPPQPPRQFEPCTTYNVNTKNCKNFNNVKFM